MTTPRSLLIALVALAVLVGARPIAGDEQNPRGLMATAEPKATHSCTIETRPLSFGIYDALAGTDLDAIGQIIYTCEKGGGGGGGGGGNSISIQMAQGQSNSFATRFMTGLGFEHLEYNIYLDATRRTIWGTGEGSTQAYIDSNPPNRTPVTVPAFGRIFGRQDVVAGPYADTVPVRILF